MTHIQNTIRRARLIGLYKPEEKRALVRSAQLDQHNAKVNNCRVAAILIRMQPAVVTSAPAHQ